MFPLCLFVLSLLNISRQKQKLHFTLGWVRPLLCEGSGWRVRSLFKLSIPLVRVYPNIGIIRVNRVIRINRVIRVNGVINKYSKNRNFIIFLPKIEDLLVLQRFHCVTDHKESDISI